MRSIQRADNGWLGMPEREGKITKGHEGNLRGNGYVHGVDCDGGVTSVSIHHT